MAQIGYKVDNCTAVVTLDEGENSLNQDFVETFLSVLDDIDHNTDADVLIVTSSHEKIFSSGIDVGWFTALCEGQEQDAAKTFLYTLNNLFKRILLFPSITIAAISGHVIGGGAILSCAFDFRFMRSDRGFFCFPEVNIGTLFFPGMLALMRKAIPGYKLEELHLTGKKATAKECEEHHIITKAYHVDDLMRETFGFSQSLHRRKEVVSEMKRRMHKDIVRTFDIEDPPLIESVMFRV